MGPLPTVTVRAAPDHFPLIRGVAARLKTDPAFAAALSAFLENAPAPVATLDAAALTARLADVERRLADLENQASPVTQVVIQHHAEPEDDPAPRHVVIHRVTESLTEESKTKRVTIRNTNPDQMDWVDMAGPPAPPAEIRDPEIAPLPGPTAAPEQAKERPPFAAALDAAIKDAGMSMKQVSDETKKRGKGVSDAMIGYYRSGKNKPSQEMRAILVEIFPSLKDIEP